VDFVLEPVPRVGGGVFPEDAETVVDVFQGRGIFDRLLSRLDALLVDLAQLLFEMLVFERFECRVVLKRVSLS
jgi:hypothetical protein